MFIQKPRATTPVALIKSRPADEARQWANCAAGLIVARTGCTRPEALNAFARAAHVASGTLENLTRERLKRLAAEDFLGIKAAFVAEIHRNIRELEAELELVRARGAADGASGADIGRAYAAIEEAKAALKKKRLTSYAGSPPLL